MLNENKNWGSSGRSHSHFILPHVPSPLSPTNFIPPMILAQHTRNRILGHNTQPTNQPKILTATIVAIIISQLCQYFCQVSPIASRWSLISYFLRPFEKLGYCALWQFFLKTQLRLLYYRSLNCILSNIYPHLSKITIKYSELYFFIAFFC